MGRMLETLKLGESRRHTAHIPKVEQAPVQDCVVDWEIGEEVPYVEVGGPDRKIEISLGALIQDPPQSAQPPHAPVVEKIVETQSPQLTLTEPEPMTVAFEPWPGTCEPAGEIASDIIAYHQPDHPTSKEYAGLLDTMLTGLQTPPPNVLLLLGLKPSVGTTTVLLNLAVVAARQPDRRVIVVDANAARPGLAQRLGHSPAGGLKEVLNGTVALEQAIIRTSVPNLHLLPTGSAKDGSQPFSAEAVGWLNAWLRKRYDLIFFDGPTIEQADAIASEAPHTHGMYLVLPHGQPAPQQQEIARTIRRMGGKLCGLIHTRIELGN